MSKLRRLQTRDVTFTLTAEQDNAPVRGNAMASGDEDDDRACEDEILERLDRGDDWAWAYVTVTARWTDPAGREHTGSAGLGACSYANEADFKRDPYYRDLCNEALDDLNDSIARDIERGRLLADTLKEGAA